MKIEGLVSRVRTEFLADDKGIHESQFLWKTAHIIAALSQAERELCKRLLLLSDSTTEAICRFTVAAVNGVYPRVYAIDDRILRIERLKFPGVTRPLVRKSLDWLDQHDSGWDETSGTPEYFVLDGDDYTVTFNRQPICGGTVSMSVKRFPLIPIIDKSPADDSPELKQKDDEIIHGALKYLYIKPDLEGYDADLSAKWGKQFEADITAIIQERAAMNPQEMICRPERF